jgi:endoglucanase Acf2
MRWMRALACPLLPADTYPTGATLTYGYQPVTVTGTGRERGIVRIRFSIATMSGAAAVGGNLMMMSMPHHRTHLLSPPLPVTTGPRVRMDDLRGELSHVLGNDWILGYDLSDIGWNAPNGIQDPARRSAVIAQLMQDAATWANSNQERDDMYFGASDMAAIGRMAVIADELSAFNATLTATAAALRSQLVARLNARLATNVSKLSSLVYDTTWGGIIGYGDASQYAEANFGNRL